MMQTEPKRIHMTRYMIRTTSYRKNHPAIPIVGIFIALVLVTGCSFGRHAMAMLRSTDHFVPSQDDPRVLFELGADDYAEKVSSFLPSAIQQIEEKQYRPFPEPVQVYVCASRESFKKYYGADVRAGVSTKLFLSPRVFEKGDKIAKMYLTHELSHLHLLQQLGLYKVSRLPFWFKEGLATYGSNGGGADLISQKQAIEYIRAGKHFVPNKRGGVIFQKTPSDFDLKPHMFYRQSMMFISYLVTINELKFREFLLSVENGAQIASAIHNVYNKNLEELWSEFIKNIKDMS